MQKYQDSISVNTNGHLQALGNAIITIQNISGGSSQMYSDNGITPIASTTSDSNGKYSFYANDGRYTLTVSGPAIVTQTITDVMINDSLADDVSDTSLAASSGSALIGANAYQTQNDINLEQVSPNRFGAIGNGVIDDAVALQAMFNSGAKNFLIPAGKIFYSSVILTVPTGAYIGGRGTLKFAVNTGLGVLSDTIIEHITLQGTNANRTTIVTDFCIRPATTGTVCNNNKYSRLTINDFGGGIVGTGTNIEASDNTFNRIGTNSAAAGTWDPSTGACITTWNNGYGAFGSGTNLKILNNVAYDCGALSFLLNTTKVLIHGNSLDRASYIGCGQQGCNDLTLSDNTIYNTFDNSFDIQQCSDVVIANNKITDAGTSSSSSTGDRKAIFFGTDGLIATAPYRVTITGNIIKQTSVTGTDYKGGFNLSSVGAHTVNVSGNVFVNVLNVLNGNIDSINITGNTFTGCSLIFNHDNPVMFSSNYLCNSFLSTDSLKNSSIVNNVFSGYLAANVTMMAITGATNGSYRLRVNGNTFITGYPRSLSYFGIGITVGNIQSLDVSNNKIDSALLIQGLPAGLPNLFRGNVSEVAGGAADPTNGGIMDVVYFIGTVIGASGISVPLNGFNLKPQFINIVLYSTSAAAVMQKTYQLGYCSFGYGATENNLTLVSSSAVMATVDFTVTEAAGVLTITAAANANSQGGILIVGVM